MRQEGLMLEVPPILYEDGEFDHLAYTEYLLAVGVGIVVSAEGAVVLWIVGRQRGFCSSPAA